MFSLQISGGGVGGTARLEDGETVIGRATTCGVTVNAQGVSRQHARVRVAGGRAFLTDLGSINGTVLNGVLLAGEKELHGGDQFQVGELTITVEQAVAELEFLSERTPELDSPGTLRQNVDDAWLAASEAEAAKAAEAQVRPVEEPKPSVRIDRSDGRLLRLLGEISRTLVTNQPLPQVLAKVTDLVFDSIPAERVFLMLRDSFDEPLQGRVMRNRDGSTPANISLSRTVLSTVMRDRVAMLATDAMSDDRLDSYSIFAMKVRSFMCAPLWNRNEVIGVLYCDNPVSKKFNADDLEVFTALSNYAAVSIDQARMSQQLFDESNRRARLQRYHSPGVVHRILRAGAGETGGEQGFIAQEREVSVMFCDIAGFTQLCENLAPAAVGELLNSYFGRMADVIFEHDGTLDKFIGDAILAVFGAPFDQPDHAVRSVTAALAMQRELADINATRSKPIRMRMAINSGKALAGDIGSPKRKEFTVLGDVVNTASRIEGSVAQPGQIVISQSTRALIGDAFKVKSLGTVTLRGRESQTEVFEVIA